MSIESVFEGVAVGFEAAGIAAMLVGFAIALVLAVRRLLAGASATSAVGVLRTTIGASILLGLEILVAADLVKTITSKPSLEDAAVLGIIVLIRTVLSVSIQIEIEGVLPWRRALTTSGGKLLVDAVRHDASLPTEKERP